VFLSMMYDKYFELNESEVSKIKSIKSFENYEEDKIVDNFVDINEINEEGVDEEEILDEEESDIEEEAEFGKEVDGKNLQSFYNPDPLMFTDREDLAETVLSHQICGNYKVLLQSTIHAGSPKPKNLFEAPTSKDWLNWRKTISTEFKNMHEKDVWEIVRKSEVLEIQRTLQGRWVFVQKDDGRFCAGCSKVIFLKLLTCVK
jgi:hypothetical protein